MGYDTNPVFSPDGRSLIWIGMERDGYESDLQVMYLYDLSLIHISSRINWYIRSTDTIGISLFLQCPTICSGRCV